MLPQDCDRVGRLLLDNLLPATRAQSLAWSESVSAARQPKEENMGDIGKYAFIVGIVLAFVAGFASGMS